MHHDDLIDYDENMGKEYLFPLSPLHPFHPQLELFQTNVKTTSQTEMEI